MKTHTHLLFDLRYGVFYTDQGGWDARRRPRTQNGGPGVWGRLLSLSFLFVYFFSFLSSCSREERISQGGGWASVDWLHRTRICFLVFPR